MGDTPAQVFARVLEGLRGARTADAIAECRQGWFQADTPATEGQTRKSLGMPVPPSHPFKPWRRVLVSQGIFRVELDEREGPPVPTAGTIHL